MPEIKTRETVKDIKILDKASVAGERMKQAFIRSKDTAQNLMDDGQVSPSEYAEDKIRYAAEDVVHDTGHAIRKETDKAVDKGRRAFREHRREKRLEHQEKKVDDAVRASLALSEDESVPTLECICSRCRRDGFNDAVKLRRADPCQVEMELCSYCGQNRGYDFWVFKSKKNPNGREHT